MDLRWAPPRHPCSDLPPLAPEPHFLLVSLLQCVPPPHSSHSRASVPTRGALSVPGGTRVPTEDPASSPGPSWECLSGRASADPWGEHFPALGCHRQQLVRGCQGQP